MIETDPAAQDLGGGEDPAQMPGVVDCLTGGGEMGAMMREMDWSRTPLGPVSGWSQPLRTMVGMVLRNRFPLSLWWGPNLVQFYNDPFRPILASKHPAALGQSGSECWAEIRHIIGPMIEGPFAGGPATGSEDLSLLIHRSGFFEETHFRVAYSPVPDEAAAGTGIGGVLATVSETTAQVQSERQFRTLRALAGRAAKAKSVAEACANAAAALGENPSDVPFSLFYLLDDGASARLSADSGFGAEPVAARPSTVELANADPLVLWPLATTLAHSRIEVIDCHDARFGPLPTGPWAEPPRSAIILPLAAPGQERPYGVMIAAISPHRRLDDDYRSFFELAAAQVVNAFLNARAYEEERRRAEALAQIDRAKTAFFSNVSHEFRTPLALMIGPIEDALALSERALAGSALEMVHRNALRLLKLVNSLLDFSRMEAGRVEASYQATDLAQLTADLSSQFRAAMEKGGLRVVVEVPGPGLTLEADPFRLAQILSNLLTNAAKFTDPGGVITISAEAEGEAIVVRVKDTGIGIDASLLPRVFDAFAQGVQGSDRALGGLGLGLTIVKSLVDLHGGQVEAHSAGRGKGSEFVVRLPAWNGSTALSASQPAPQPPLSRGKRMGLRVLLVDDNEDAAMLLSEVLRMQGHEVVVAHDGAAALQAVATFIPEVALLDIGLPVMDGYELARHLRAQHPSPHLRIIAITGYGEEKDKLRSMAAGFDEHLVKPVDMDRVCDLLAAPAA